MGQSWPLFVYFRSLLVTISTQIEKNVDGMLGIQTWGCRMVGADETMELWRPQIYQMFEYPIRILYTSITKFTLEIFIGSAPGQEICLPTWGRTLKIVFGEKVLLAFL